MKLEMAIPAATTDAARRDGAFALLVARHGAALSRLVRRLVYDEEEARDLVQSALADACERWDELRDEAAAEAWLRRIAVSRAMSHLRHRRVLRRAARFFGLGGAAPERSTDAAVDEARRVCAVRLAVQDLPARQAAAFSLRYFEGLGLDEIAQAMGVGRGTVRTHLTRALVALRETLADDGGAT